ncbi:MAG: alpha/beta hydrolase [Actinomycetota bacterium]|nr:alpha/beta hydrolase [Actinomycetota bacterium]
MRRRMLSVVLALAAGYLGAGLYVVLRMTSPRPGPPEATPAFVGLAYEEVELWSTDGIRLGAWWVPAEGSSRAAVLVPGWGGGKSDEHVLRTVPVYNRAGYGVLVFDTRAQGESDGERRTLGYREVRDVLGALAWLRERGYAMGDVVLHGWSMGGATALRAAPGTGVAAVVEEAGYADLPLLLKGKIPEVVRFGGLFKPAILLAGRLFPDFDAWAVRPEREAAELCKEGVPLFVVHSIGDGVVPYEHAAMLAAAHPGARVWKLEGYGHVGAFEHPEYGRRLTGFLETLVIDGGPEG